METRAGNIREPPVLWSIPFALLLIMLIVAAADVLFTFIPLDIGYRTWTWIVSTLITTIIASFVTEALSTDNKRAVLSMGLAALVSSLIYNELSNFIQRSIVDVIQGSTLNPLLGTAVYTSLLAIVPGAVTGIILGGILGYLPGIPSLRQKDQSVVAPSGLARSQRVTYEKTCGSCGRQAALDSRFCPFCGVELTRREAPSIKFCRFCGARIQYLGKYCPECGQKIDLTTA